MIFREAMERLVAGDAVKIGKTTYQFKGKALMEDDKEATSFVVSGNGLEFDVWDVVEPPRMVRLTMAEALVNANSNEFIVREKWHKSRVARNVDNEILFYYDTGNGYNQYTRGFYRIYPDDILANGWMVIRDKYKGVK